MTAWLPSLTPSFAGSFRFQATTKSCHLLGISLHTGVAVARAMWSQC
jgi:hypothetical protein